MADKPVTKYESEDDIKTPADEVKLWQQELTASQAHLERFWKRCDLIEQIYLDEERNQEQSGGLLPEGSKVNLFWSNVQVLKSMLYVRPPKIEVSRRYKDYSDDVARVAGEMMERLLNNDVERDESDFGTAARQGIMDWLTVGLGQLWMRYEAHTEQVQKPPIMSPDGMSELAPALNYEEVVSEDSLSDYLHWRDFLWSPARTWSEVRWCARRVNLTRDKGVKRFGERFRNVPLDTSTAKKDKDGGVSKVVDNTPWAQVEVFEVWNLADRTVRWVNMHADFLLDSKPDPLKLERFFPCPRPLLGTTTNSDLVPRADYSMAQDQYKQTNILATRIKMLTEACKLVGVYDKQAEGVQRMLNQGVENQLIPVDNWAAFAEKGGIKGSVDFLPIAVVSEVIVRLREDMAAQKEQLYEVLGIADIMRGITRATETATAQQIKAQYGSTRVQAKQFEVGSWVAQAQTIKAEIISLHFQPKTIIERSNVMNTPDSKYAEQAVGLLKQRWAAAYRLQIEPESMSAMDWSSERDARVQFLAAIGGFLQQAVPLAQLMPATAPMLLQIMQWVAGGFRVGRSIETVIEQLADAMGQQGQQASGAQQPTPQEQADVKKTESEADRNRANTLKLSAEVAQMTGMAGAPIGPAGLAPPPGQPGVPAPPGGLDGA